jgi:hypothetical protein
MKFIFYIALVILVGLIFYYVLHPITAHNNNWVLSSIENTNSLKSLSSAQILALEKSINITVQQDVFNLLSVLLRGFSVLLSIISIGTTALAITFWIFRESILKKISIPLQDDIDKKIEQLTGSSLASAEKLVSDLKFKIESELNKTEENVKSLESSVKVDRIARSLSKKQLDIGLIPEEIEQFKEAIKKAESYTKATIFYNTKEFYINSFRYGEINQEFDNIGIEKTAIIFESLADSDQDNKYFRSRSYLSYILGYRNPPELDRAIKLIDEAIKIRDQNNETLDEYYFYEFKKAIFLIKLRETTQKSDINQNLSCSMRKYYPVRLIVRDVLTQEKNFEQKNQGRYIIANEFDLLREWTRENPEISNYLDSLEELEV